MCFYNIRKITFYKLKKKKKEKGSKNDSRIPTT